MDEGRKEGMDGRTAGRLGRKKERREGRKYESVGRKEGREGRKEEGRDGWRKEDENEGNKEATRERRND